MKHRRTLSVFLFGIFVSFSAQAQNAPYIPVGQAKTKRSVIAYAPTKASSPAAISAAQTIEKTVTNDLSFTDLFKFLPPAAFIEPPTAGLQPPGFKITDWSSIGADLLIKTSVTNSGNNFELEAYFYDTQKAQALVAKKYTGTKDAIVTIGHTFANDIIQSLTGQSGIFLSKIAMVCDLTGKKEIYIMDFDGSDVRQLTQHRSLSFAPDWHPDGTRLAYSLITRHAKGIRNIDLFEFDFKTNRSSLLSNRKGINSGANYSPNGNTLALTMSFLGNPEIFTMNLSDKTVKRITSTFGVDVDPSWSPDGSKMLFASSRSGKPMIYVSDADGTNAKRLTFAGQYNATPHWSPTNNKIVFAGWLDKGFDIFLMNPDGTKIERLTKSAGSNENPHFSPDGNFIVFSSNRTGKNNVYVMNIDGTFVKRLTYGLGSCEAPKWSPVPKVK